MNGFLALSLGILLRLGEGFGGFLGFFFGACFDCGDFMLDALGLGLSLDLLGTKVGGDSVYAVSVDVD